MHFNSIVINDHCIFNNCRQAAIGSIVLPQIDGNGQKRFGNIFRSQIATIRKFHIMP